MQVFGAFVGAGHHQTQAGEVTGLGLPAVAVEEQGRADEYLGPVLLDDAGDDFEIQRVGVSDGGDTRAQGHEQGHVEAHHMEVGQHRHNAVELLQVYEFGDGIE